MTTNLAVVSSSLRLLGVIAAGETPDDNQGADALVALNQMLERWIEDGIDLGYSAQTDLDSTCPIPSWAEQGVISKLSQRLMADYPSLQVHPWVLNDEENGFGTIRRKLLTEQIDPADMSHMGSGGSQWDVTSDRLI